jgi:hypothetical protein
LTQRFAPDSAPSGQDVLARQLSRRPTGLACALF